MMMEGLNNFLKGFLVACIVLACQVSGHAHSSDSDAFVEFMAKYKKNFTSADEFNKRFGVWQENVEKIRRHNEEYDKGLHSYTMAINKFGDMTVEEFRATMFGFKYDENKKRSQGNHVSSTSLPDSVDWRAKGYVTEVGNQGGCGSCWAFTATGALEGQHKKKTGVLVDLSEQNLMDCSAKEGNAGCCGGELDFSYEYVIKNGGIDTEQSYPYNLTNPGEYTCKYTEANRGATCTGYVDLPKGNETALQQAVAEIGPIASAIDAMHESFQFYKSGVYDEPACNPDKLCLTLLVVGYGTLDGKEYYDCKNSWGAEWGEEGYIKMARNRNNQCGIATLAGYPLM